MGKGFFRFNLKPGTMFDSGSRNRIVEPCKTVHFYNVPVELEDKVCILFRVDFCGTISSPD